MHHPDFKTRILQRLKANSDLFRLFDSLTDVCFFAKDWRGQFIMGNRAFLEKLGLDREEDLIGKNDLDFLPARLVEIFLRDDQWVIRTGKPLIDRVELLSNSEGSVDWHITTKVPLVARNNHTLGIAGITRDFRRSGERWRPHRQFAAVIEHIDRNYGQPIQVENLASLMFLSINQFERKFKQVFQVSPMKFLTGYRVHRACYDLLHTDHTITQIAIRNGFYDHSHFTRHFRNAMGMTPNQYRRS